MQSAFDLVIFAFSALADAVSAKFVHLCHSAHLITPPMFPEPTIVVFIGIHRRVTLMHVIATRLNCYLREESCCISLLLLQLLTFYGRYTGKPVLELGDFVGAVLLPMSPC